MSHDPIEPVALPTDVTPEQLRAVVATSRSWRAVMRTFDLRSSAQGRLLRRACDDLAIDYGHFAVRTWSDEQLSRALTTGRSWPEVLKALGYAEDSGSARATVRKHAVRLGLDHGRLSRRPEPERGAPFGREVNLDYLREAGPYLVAGACALMGFKVSWPLEPAIYDLIVDADGALLRIQVKTTTWQLEGAWACKITRREGSERAWYTKQDIDYFGVVDAEQRVYMIPVEAVEGTGTIIVRHYDGFRLGHARSTAGQGVDSSRSLRIQTKDGNR